MTTEPYVPDWTDIRDRYALHTSVHTGATVDEARRDAERGIAKIRAEAWDEGQEAGWGEAQEQWVISGMVGDLHKHSTTPNPHRAQEASNE